MMFPKFKMFFKSKESLRTIHAAAQKYASAVPDKARYFHKNFNRLSNEIQSALSKFWVLWISTSEFEDYNARLKKFEMMAVRLPDLFRQAEIQKENAREILENIESQDDYELSEYFRERAESWQRNLQRLGTDCEREGDINNDKFKLNEIRKELSDYKKNMLQIEKARNILKKIGRNIETANLEVLLTDIIGNLKKDGIARKQFKKLNEEIDRLGKIALHRDEEIERAQRSCEHTGNILDDLSGWANVFSEFKQEVQQLDSDNDLIVGHPEKRSKEKEIALILEKALHLKNNVMEKVNQNRSEKITQLDEKMRIFSENFGPVSDPRIPDKVKSLKAQKIERNQDYKKWLRDYESVNTSFLGIAGAKLNSFYNTCIKNKENLCNKLEALIKTPMLKTSMTNAKDLLHDISKRRYDGNDLFALFRELHNFREYEMQVEKLVNESLKDIDDFNNRLNTVFERNESLQTEAAQLGLSANNIEKDISALKTKSSGNQSLEQSLKKIDQLESRYDKIAQDFINACNNILSKENASIEAAHKLITVVSLNPVPPLTAPGNLATGWSLGEAREVVEKIKEEGQVFLARIGEETMLLEEQCPIKQKDLKRLSHTALSPDDRLYIEQLSGEFEKKGWASVEEPVKKLRLIWKLIDRTDLFLSRLLREEKEIKRRLKILKKSYKDFNDNHLHTYCPSEFNNRLSALINGMPDNPKEWRSVKKQLIMTEILFEQLNNQALHLAADKLEINVLKLQSVSRSSKDKKVIALLKELEKYGDTKPVPVDLRLKIEAAQLI